MRAAGIGPGVETPGVADEHAAMARAFEEGVREAPELVRERRFRIAGQPVHLRVLGSRFAREVAVPFEHLPAPDVGEAPSIRIDVQHGAEHGDPPPRDPRYVDRLGAYGAMSASPDGRYVAEHRPHSAVWLDRESARIVAWFSRDDLRQLDERARPFHRLLAVAMADRGVQFAHAGLVASGGRGALLVGRGGSGKSTTALTCLLHGLDFLGDDFVGIQEGEDGHRGHSLYRSAVVGLDHADRLPGLRAAGRPGHHAYETKWLVQPEELGGGRLVPEVPLAAILLPRIAGSVETRLRPATPHDSLMALAPSSLLLVPGSHTRALERLSSLTTAVPSWWLDLGEDLEGIPPRVRERLETP